MEKEKKQKQQTKTCSDCIHESACRGWTCGRYISDDSASQCPNHQTVKESGAYLCGVLDERKRKKTNADRIRSMSDEELASMLKDYKDCSKNCIISNGKHCYQICEEESVLLKWLQQPAEEEETDNETVGERKDGDD